MCRPKSAATVCPASVCLGIALAQGSSKPRIVLTLRLLISCDRCIPPGGAEFELFIKTHESVRRRAALGQKAQAQAQAHAHTLLTPNADCQ